MTAHTNFGSFSHQQLYAMLHAGDSGGARAAAEKWRAAGFGLFEQADNLMSELTEFDGHWTGGAADKYKIMIDDLVGGIRKVGQTAVSMRHLLEDAADELDTAKAEMPPPVNVPEVSPADLSLAVNPPLLPADASPDLMQAAAQRRATAIGNVEAQQQASNAANAAHSKAIQVMTDLAGDYTAAEESIPASPNAAVPPALAPGSPGGGASGGGAPVAPPPGGVSVVPGAPPTLPGDGTTPMPMPVDQGKPSSPLFGNMFTAGLAAASAAAFGRFGSIMPKVPPWAGDKKEGEQKPPGDGTGKLGDGFGGGAGGGGVPIGGGSVGGLGGGGVGGVDLGSPGDGAAAAPGMAGSGGAAPGLSGLAGGAAGAAGAAAAKGMMPMMPFMPMGMGAGDMGSGRRIPPWLVETEDVWGESSVVAPSVIGEEPDAQR